MILAANYKGKIDFGIITIREDEFDAVLDRFPTADKIVGRRSYSLSFLETFKNSKYTIASVRCSEQGTGEGQNVARDLIEDLDPQWLVVVGIGGGIPSSDYTLGDVVTATRLIDFTVSAHIEGYKEQFASAGGPMHKVIQDLAAYLPAMKQELGDWNSDFSIRQPTPHANITTQNVYGKPNWKKKVQESIDFHFHEGKKKRLSKVVTGTIVSSDRLVKDTGTIENWLQTARQLMGVEMELAGVYHAARQRDKEYPILTIRGISDIVGFKRDDAWTRYACNVASSFAYSLLKTEPISPRNNQNTDEKIKSIIPVQPLGCELSDEDSIKEIDGINNPSLMKAETLFYSPKYNFDLGTVWGLERDSFIGFLISQDGSRVINGLKNVEENLQLSLKLTNREGKLLNRLWFDVDPLIENKNSTINKLSSNQSLGLFIQLDEKHLSDFQHIITAWRRWLVNTKNTQIALIFCLLCPKPLGEKLLDLTRKYFNDITDKPLRVDYAITSVYEEKSIPLFSQMGKSYHGQLYNWIRKGIESASNHQGVNYPEITYKQLIDLILASPKVADFDYAKIELSASQLLKEIPQYRATGFDIERQLLEFTRDYLPQHLPDLVAAFACSDQKKTRRTGLVFSAENDSLLDIWVNTNLPHHNYYPDFSDLRSVNNLDIRKNYILALIRQLKTFSFYSSSIRQIIEKLKSVMPAKLKKLYEYSEDKIELTELLKILSPNEISLANRAGIKLFCDAKALNKISVSSMPDIWQELKFFPVDLKNLSAFLKLDVKKRSILGLCSIEEWRQLNITDPLAVSQILLSRRNRILNFA